MAKNTMADLDATAANNTDALGQAITGASNANTIETMIQSVLGLLARFYGDLGGTGTVAGTADAITLTTGSTYQALESGIIVSFKAASANTGATTINVDSLGVKKVRLRGDSALTAGHIAANGRYLLIYDTAYDSAAGAWVLLNPEVTGSVNLADGTLTRPVLKDYGETVNAIGSTGGGTQDIDLTLGNVVTATVDTSANTFTFSNPSASGTACSFTFIVTNGGSQTVNWPASVDWSGGSAPTLTTSGRDVLSFLTVDAGTIWYGFVGGIAFA